MKLDNLHKNELIEAAVFIKNWCTTIGMYNEKECPFFKGYVEENGVKIVQCELNKGKTSPCNWELKREFHGGNE